MRIAVIENGVVANIIKVRNSHTLADNEKPDVLVNPASIGHTYDEERNAYIAPQPYPSWVLDEETCVWGAPVEKPGLGYLWDEDALDWVKPDSPFASWVWNADIGFWVAPVPMPEDGGAYTWDEEAGDWVAVPEDTVE